MNRFAFRYENLLEVKGKYEDLVKGKLNKAVQKLEDEKKHLEKLEGYKRACHNDIASKIEEGTVVSFLQTYNVHLIHIKRKIEEQMEIIQKCNHEVSKCRVELIQASKEKKTFEKLKERAKENFHYNEKKEEENFVDQLVTFNNFKKN